MVSNACWPDTLVHLSEWRLLYEDAAAFVRGVALATVIIVAPRTIVAEEAWVCHDVEDHFGYDCTSCADYGSCPAAGYDHVWLCCNNEGCHLDGDHHESTGYCADD